MALAVAAATGFTFPLASVDAFDSSFGNAFAAIQVDNDGTVISTIITGSTNLGPWVVPPAAAPLFWCRITGGSGTAPAGSALNTWLACTSDRAWSLTQNGAGTKAYSATLQFATDAAGANIVASIPFSLSADAF